MVQQGRRTAPTSVGPTPRLKAWPQAEDELIHLIEALPDDQVEVLLEDARRLTAAKPIGTWPPAFFGAGVSKDGGTDVACNIDEYLAEGFGASRP